MKFYFNCQIPDDDFFSFLENRYEFEKTINKYFINQTHVRICFEHRLCGIKKPKDPGAEFNMKELQNYRQDHKNEVPKDYKYKMNYLYPKICSEKSIISSKVIRITKLGQPLVNFLESDKENMKIIYVFRDPRAIMNSVFSAKILKNFAKEERPYNRSNVIVDKLLTYSEKLVDRGIGLVKFVINYVD